MNGGFRSAQAVELTEALNRFGVRYLLIGKGAAVLLGFPGTTLDVDVFPDKTPENARRIVEAIKSLGFDLPEQEERNILAMRDFVQLMGRFSVDLVFAPDGIERFSDAYARREDVDGIPVANLKDIIASKRAANRAKDRMDLPMLELFAKDYARMHRQAKGNAMDDEPPPILSP